MKLFSAHRWALVAATMLAGPTLLEAQVLRCNMTSPCGNAPAPPCGSCPVGPFVWHASANPCTGSNGSFNLIGTGYENTCALGNGCTVGQPLLRYWQYDFYSKANNGCQKQDDVPAGTEWMVNAFLDDGTSPAPGHWYMYQASWTGPSVDGCYNAPGAPSPRTVAELSFVDANGPSHTGTEGTINHGSFYLVNSVPLTQQFEFDTTTGGTGCTAAEVKAAPVAGLTIVGRTLACTGNATPTTSGTADVLTGYHDIGITLSDPNPDWYNESGLNGAPPLIVGYQIVYKTGAEPTTSATSAWAPVYDPTDNTAPKNALGVVLLGTATAVTVAVPDMPAGTNYWFATRIVYQDVTENPTAPFDPATGTPSAPVGPQITSQVSGHCGPVQFGTSPVAVEYGSVTAERNAQGVNVRWTTIREDDTNGFKVFRSNDAAGTEALVEAASWVDAHGANLEYAVTDLSASSSQTYYYYVQEMTSNGFGDRSESVRVDPATATGSRGGSSGGRTRGQH